MLRVEDKGRYKYFLAMARPYKEEEDSLEGMLRVYYNEVLLLQEQDSLRKDY